LIAADGISVFLTHENAKAAGLLLEVREHNVDLEIAGGRTR
jgi:hypothetical protein